MVQRLKGVRSLEEYIRACLERHGIPKILTGIGGVKLRTEAIVVCLAKGEDLPPAIVESLPEHLVEELRALQRKAREEGRTPDVGEILSVLRRHLT